MIPAWLGVILAVLGIAVGIFASHATLGNKVTRALTLLEDLTRRVTMNEDDVSDLRSVLHFHRRKGDVT